MNGFIGAEAIEAVAADVVTWRGGIYAGLMSLRDVTGNDPPGLCVLLTDAFGEPWAVWVLSTVALPDLRRVSPGEAARLARIYLRLRAPAECACPRRFGLPLPTKLTGISWRQAG